ncbi:hypothetical protein EG328_004558 [Venturia inaequalis]|uniref:Cyanovirin-N domain-containing protein n=1 Tax=Venturia inaequalis TaxID=5025 RepID=A0A8H3VH56_VENIN|nr:hypothetical protein EG327_007775 [Venturia inaequalis]KAE9986839.1 hypothetical protein EG328_004558 [Venturia inaequalis]
MYLSLLTGLSLLATQTLAQVAGCGSGTRSGTANWKSGGNCNRQGNTFHCPGGGYIDLLAGKVALHGTTKDITVNVHCPGVNALFWCHPGKWQTFNLAECNFGRAMSVELVNE